MNSANCFSLGDIPARCQLSFYFRLHQESSILSEPLSPVGIAPGPVIIIGGGPAGLTAAHELMKHKIHSLVLEKDSVVGGISRTAEYKGYLFDIGGHRFFTKVGLVEKMWHEVLGADFISRPRMSRIFYQRKFFNYPLEPRNALRGLGLFEAVHCGVSFLWAQVAPQKPEDNFEAWISNRFGGRLFKIFFESYTERSGE